LQQHTRTWIQERQHQYRRSWRSITRLIVESWRRVIDRTPKLRGSATRKNTVNSRPIAVTTRTNTASTSRRS
jgi:hypothetical protein